MTARQIVLPGVEDTQALGRALGALLRAGDLVVLTGGLGAGKTTLTQGLGDGLGVRGPVTSPTFVIARVHPSLVGGPVLVHVDAYRLGGALGSTLSTSMPPSRTASPLSSGGRGWPRTSVRTGSRSCSTSTRPPRCAP